MNKREGGSVLARQPDNELVLSAFDQQGALSSHACQSQFVVGVADDSLLAALRHIQL